MENERIPNFTLERVFISEKEGTFVYPQKLISLFDPNSNTNAFVRYTI